MDTAEKSTLDFKITDATSYDAHVGDFQRFSAALTTPLARRMIAMADISAGERVLDIGTGTGVVALEAAKAAGDRGKCIGVDLSEKMLASARGNACRENLTKRIEFIAMDAESLQFETASFDVVLSLFALLHFPNPAIALSEMFRVLKPGGTLAEESSLARAGSSRSRTVPRLIRDVGFENLRQHWEGHQAVLDTPEDFWAIQRTFSSIARKRLNSASSNQVAKVRAKFDELCRKVLSRGGRLTYPFAAFFVAARRPLQS